MASKAKKTKEPTTAKKPAPRRFTKAEKALFELNAKTVPDPNWTEQDGIDLLERQRRGDYS